MDNKKTVDKSRLNVKDILAFADEVKIEDIEPIIKRQIEDYLAISDKGLEEKFGAEVGRNNFKVQ